MRGHADLRAEDILAIVDKDEKTPLDLLLPSVKAQLETGDYSVNGLEDFVTVERKSLPDLVMCCGRERDRFEKCVQRMRGFEVRVIVIEASWPEVHAGAWRGQMTPGQVKAALYSWMKHTSVVMAGDRKSAAAVVSGILLSAARERWRQVQPFMGGLKLVAREGA